MAHDSNFDRNPLGGSSIDLLEFGDGKRIKKMQVGKWDIGKSSIDYHSLIPKM